MRASADRHYLIWTAFGLGGDPEAGVPADIWSNAELGRASNISIVPWSRRSPRGTRRAVTRPAPTLLFTRSLLRRFDGHFLPGVIGVERGHVLRDVRRVQTEVFFEHRSPVIDQEGHHARIAIDRRIGDQGEAADHLAMDYVVVGTARRCRAL